MSEGRTLPDGGPRSGVREWQKRLFAFMFRPTSSLWRYGLSMALLSFLPSLFLVALVWLVLLALGIDPDRWMPEHGPMTALRMFVMVILTPFIETALLALGLWALKHFIRREVLLAAASAVLWGFLHATQAPLWFVGTTWSFFVLSAAYIAWRPYSKWRAFCAALIPHVIVNFLAVGMMRAGL